MLDSSEGFITRLRRHLQLWIHDGGGNGFEKCCSKGEVRWRSIVVFKVEQSRLLILWEGDDIAESNGFK